MRRKSAFLLSVCGLLTASALGASTAVASPAGTGSSASASAGWVRLDAHQLAKLAADTGRSTRAEGSSEVIPLQWIQSARNGLAASAERNYKAPENGLLRARSSTVDLWELYDIYVIDASGTVALNSHANGLYVAAELNYPGDAKGVLRARSSTVASWERFWLYYNDDTGRFALESTANWRFVSMEFNYKGSLQYALRARSEAVAGSWEEFNIIDSQSA